VTLRAVGKGVACILLSPIALMGAVLGALIGSRADPEPEEVAEALRNFLRGDGEPWDWDDFTSVPIKDPLLESIRQRAVAIDLPASAESLGVLEALLGEAEALCARR